MISKYHYTIFARTFSGSTFVTENISKRNLENEWKKFIATVNYFNGGYVYVFSDNGKIVHRYCSSEINLDTVMY